MPVYGYSVTTSLTTVTIAVRVTYIVWSMMQQQ